MIEEMINAMHQNKQEIKKCIDTFGFMTEKDNAKVLITIEASTLYNRTEAIFNSRGTAIGEKRTCCINQLNDEDIEALKGIICRKVTSLKKKNVELANKMISMLQEEADQGSGDK